MEYSEQQKEILDRIKQIDERCWTLGDLKTDAREQLVDAIREATDAGIPYSEIGKILGIGKSGVSQIVARSK